ncbi:MAG: insulinase family protein [Betaproteobacteria bacterium]|nr:insulinase family protein [Betaproteobacteria bacterium]
MPTVSPSLLLCVLAFFAPLTAANTLEHRFANGLKLIVKEDRRAPTVVQQMWYRTGSMDERSGTTGVAHVLEHMMFKGTSRFGPGEFSRRISSVGGRENAFTGRDYTVYFQQVQRDSLALAMELEADRMTNLVIRPGDFTNEIQVVMEERRLRTEDRPRSLVFEAMMAAAYTAHPYRWPIIGWMEDLAAMKYGDAEAWYRQWYAPENAVLIIVGDVNAKSVVRLAQRYYGTIKRRALSVRRPQSEATQRGIRRVAIKAPADAAYLILGFKAPVSRDLQRDWEPAALEVLAGVLSGNDSARLNQSLVRDSRVATDASAGYDQLARGPGMFYLHGTVAPGRATVELETGFREAVSRIVAEGVTAKELERVKRQLAAGEIYKRDSIFAQAMQIGLLENAGFSHRDIDTMLIKLNEVTAEQVRAVARKYLVDDGLTVAVLDPQPLDARPPRAGAPAVRH